MKRYLLLAIITFGLCSCNEWLEATSSTQFKADALLGSEEGFQDALTGAYIKMGSISAYGGNLTWKYNDLTTYPYLPFTSQQVINFQNHVYDNINVKNEIDATWLALYNAIANVNFILDNIDSRRDVFTSQKKMNWIKGECLAIRAFCHFDLMRLFGTWEWGNGNESKLAVPYVLHYSAEITPQKSYSETVDLLMSDIEGALELLSDDPITGNIPDDFDFTVNADGYWNNRNLHLNLYAVEALLARVYMWQQDYARAEETAREVVDECFAAEAVSWVDVDKIVSTASNDQKDWTFSTEHIFTLEVTGLYEKASGFILPTAGGTGDGTCRLDQTFCEAQLFPTLSEEGLEDIRGTVSQLRYFAGSYVSNKLYGSSSSIFRNKMPMLKISEMYYILAECSARDGRKAEALTYMDEVRTHRGITSNYADSTDAMQQLFWEYMREFINEGQFFYYLKRDNLEHKPNFVVSGSAGITTTVNLRQKDLVFPYPDEEIFYGRNQEL